MKEGNKLLFVAGYIAFAAVAASAQGTVGQVNFANRVEGVFDAPVTIQGGSPVTGPGPDYTAQLYLQASTGSLTPLPPTSTFFAAGSGVQAIADRYWEGRIVDVPGVTPGADASFVVRVWKTSFGNYDSAAAADLQAFHLGGFSGNSGQSAPFSVAVGGGTLPAANLVTLQAFTLGLIPEPTIPALLALGSLLYFGERKVK